MKVILPYELVAKAALALSVIECHRELCGVPGQCKMESDSHYLASRLRASLDREGQTDARMYLAEPLEEATIEITRLARALSAAEGRVKALSDELEFLAKDWHYRSVHNSRFEVCKRTLCRKRAALLAKEGE